MPGIYGIGIDIALIKRFDRVLNLYGERFLKKALHPAEIETYGTLRNNRRAHFVASRSGLELVLH